MRSIDDGVQGVSVARMGWSNRDAPTGAFAAWQNGAWVSPTLTQDPDGNPIWLYPTGTPIFPAHLSWHSDDGLKDAFWGASIRSGGPPPPSRVSAPTNFHIVRD